MNPTLPYELLKDVGIPEPYWNLPLETYCGSAQTLKDLQHYLECFEKRPSIGFCLHGASRTGKTFFATLFLKSLLVREFDSCLYITLEDLLQKVSEGFNVMEYFREIQFLFVDDVEFLEGAGRLLRRMLRVRLSRGLPVYFATSLSESRLVEVFGSDSFDLLSANLLFFECSVNRAQLAKMDEARKAIFHRKGSHVG